MYKKESSLISSPDRNINISEATPGVPNTLARVNNRRKEQVTTFLDEGLPAISDSSFWYHLIKNNFNMPVIQKVISQDARNEICRLKNYKGGMVCKFNKVFLKKNDIADFVSVATVFKSKIDLSSSASEIYNREKGADLCFQNLQFVVDNFNAIQDDIKTKASTFFDALGCYILISDDMRPSYQDKASLLEQFLQEEKRVFFQEKTEHDLLEKIMSDKKIEIEQLSMLVNSFIAERNYGLNFSKDIENELRKLDEEHFVKDNKDIFDNLISEYAMDLSPFYYFYRMGVIFEFYEGKEIMHYEGNDGLAMPTSSSPKEKKDNLSQRYHKFVNELFKVVGRKIKGYSCSDFKKDMRKFTSSQISNYERFDTQLKKISENKNNNLESIVSSPEYNELIIDVENSEKAMLLEMSRNTLDYNIIRSVFLSILNEPCGPDQNVHVDSNFDTADWQMCYDAISMGLPVITTNVSLITQTSQSLSRSFFLGRDLQVIVLQRLLDYARKKADDPNLKIQGITQSHVWNYCKDNLDMNKLWGMKESRSGKLLSGQLPSSLDIENENLDKEGRKIGSDVIKNSSMSLISENDDANIFENSSTHNILAAFTNNINPDKSEANDKVKYIRMTLDEDQATSSGLLPVRMVRSLQQKGNHSFKLKKVPPGSSGNKESSSNPLYHSYPPG